LAGFQQVEDNLSALRILEQEAGVQGLPNRRPSGLSVSPMAAMMASYLEVITAQNAALFRRSHGCQFHGRRIASAVLLSARRMMVGRHFAGPAERCGRLAAGAE
jgi:hypothetical protein